MHHGLGWEEGVLFCDWSAQKEVLLYTCLKTAHAFASHHSPLPLMTSLPLQTPELASS